MFVNLMLTCRRAPPIVMGGLVPAIHVFGLPRTYKDVDACDERGHDELSDRIPDYAPLHPGYVRRCAYQ
jgi:hypothetical protein